MLEYWPVCDLEGALVVEVSKETRQLLLQTQPTQAIRYIINLAGIDASVDTMRSRQLTYATGSLILEAFGLKTLQFVKPIEWVKMPSIQLTVPSTMFQIYSKL